MADFIFDDSDLDAAQAERILNDTLKGADDGELFIERSTSEALSFDDGRLKTASFDSSRGFGLRCVAGEASGFAQSSELSPESLRRASDAVQLVKLGHDGVMSALPRRTNQALYPDIDPTEDPGFADKVGLLQQIDGFVRALDPEVVQVTVTLAGSRRAIAILKQDGARINDVRPLVRLNIMVIAERGGRRESGYVGTGGRYPYDQITDPSVWQPMAREALRQAQVNLTSVDAPAGQFDVVLGPGWPGVLLHEAMGHGLEGDFIRKGTSAFAGRLGDQVASRGVTIVDDGTLEGRRGSLSVDDEGTPTERTVLIEDGKLVGFMQDRLNARLMNVEPTGNGRRESFAHAPMPRMTNTFMLGGDVPQAQMIGELEDGIYASNFGGGQVDITSGKFVFQCTEAYRVRGGKIEEPLKGVTLIGDGPKVLGQIRHVGDDMALDPGIGVCGKAGQGVPVGVGQPSLYVEALTVGGTA
ncbi:TldD/PmbA family protein [Algimonas porphyrae]|uniref:Peptidase C69 n=1 Tax=Algimonas porphyrae TaxID=1128113 RepID=A0ABQ5V0M1_9PROT|nr:metallopeptidase TldD-related protein [Algimonas porphyrae]GLQ20983.1 peptidase C69 [Algimonas porphyrae]